MSLLYYIFHNELLGKRIEQIRISNRTILEFSVQSFLSLIWYPDARPVDGMTTIQHVILHAAHKTRLLIFEKIYQNINQSEQR